MTTNIRDVMTTNIVRLGQDTPLRQAAQKMRDSAIGDVLVQDLEGALCGIVTDRDIVVRGIAEGMDPNEARLRDIASTNMLTLDPDASVEAAVKCMQDNAVRRVPVVQKGKCIGIVSLGDLAVDRDRRSALGEISAAPPSN